jgi:PAS domain-containing protein
MGMDWLLGVGLVATAVLAALLGVVVLAAIQGRATDHRKSIFTDEKSGTVFLFDGDTLIDASPSGRALLSASSVRGGPMIRLMAYLQPRFPDLERRLIALAGVGRFSLASEGDSPSPLLVHAELRGGITRITIADAKTDKSATGADLLTQRAMAEELDQMREITALVPLMIWREMADGDVVWANSAYMTHLAKTLVSDQELTWPLPRIFDRTASAQGVAGQRQRIDGANGASHWFELTSQAEGAGRVVFAQPIDVTVQAETALRDFMQTLAKTFAHLPIGLAIFDKQRNLQLFNPAMLDLTGLAPDFLSLRPSLAGVLDAMRDKNMIPEPKDYRGWRKMMIEMEKAAASGLYEETWSLPSGQTYRVIGRPYPNGALALMMEDISNEMLRTRRYRADLELGQSVIDDIPEAIAVFSQGGQLLLTNLAYSDLWHHDPAAKLSESSISTLCRHWSAETAPSAMWADVENFVSSAGNRDSWNAEARLSDGRLLACRFAPIAGGATMISFRPITQVETSVPRFSTARIQKSA